MGSRGHLEENYSVMSKYVKDLGVDVSMILNRRRILEEGVSAMRTTMSIFLKR